jgi:hypothetical protein
MEYQIMQGEIIEKWIEIIQQPDTGGESVISAVRLARWVERRLREPAKDDIDEADAMFNQHQAMKAAMNR